MYSVAKGNVSKDCRPTVLSDCDDEQRGVECEPKLAQFWSATMAAAAVVERNVYEKASMSIAVSGETDAEADTFLKDKLCEQGLKGARHDPKSPRLGGHPI